MSLQYCYVLSPQKPRFTKTRVPEKAQDSERRTDLFELSIFSFVHKIVNKNSDYVHCPLFLKNPSFNFLVSRFGHFTPLLKCVW